MIVEPERHILIKHLGTNPAEISFRRNPLLRRGGRVGEDQRTREKPFQGLLELAADFLPRRVMLAT